MNKDEQKELELFSRWWRAASPDTREWFRNRWPKMYRRLRSYGKI